MSTKKVLNFLLIPITVLSFGSFFNGANAFMDWIKNDFFYNVDSWIVKLEDSVIENSFKNIWEEVVEQLNIEANYDWLKTPAFKKSEDIINDVIIIWIDGIYSSQEKVLALNRILIKREWMTQIEVEKYAKVVKEYFDIKVKESITASEKFEKMQSMWIYSDWSLLNSEFDLIDDLEEIDKILFGTTPWDYGEWNSVLWGLSQEAQDLKNKTYDSAPNFSLAEDSIYSKPDKVISDKVIRTNKNEWQKENSNTFYNVDIKSEVNSTCVIDLSWLSPNVLDSIYSNKENESWNDEIPVTSEEYKETNVSNEEKFWNIFADIYGSLGDEMRNSWSYKPTSDNFWCEEWKLFCVIVEMVKYWDILQSEDRQSIDYIITKSNEYLQVWASTSKIQWKMTTNNFELNLDNLNLWDIFSSWVIVQYKPVPFLETDSSRSDSFYSDDFTWEKIISKLYESKDLDFKDANNIENYLWIVDDNTALSKSLEFDSNTSVFEQKDQINQYKLKKQELANIIDRNIENWTSDKSDLWDFENQFNEISSFMWIIWRYTNDLESKVNLLEKIPSE